MPKRRLVDAAMLAAIVAAAAIALAQSWDRWLDPIIDAGRDLYIPEQLRHGARLYADIRYNYPPLAPYLLAAITALHEDETHSPAATPCQQRQRISGLSVMTSLNQR